MKESIAIILKLVLYTFSFLIPRNKKKWLFGSSMGYTGNAKYLFLEMNDKQEDSKSLIWIANSKKEALIVNGLGFKAFYKKSFKGIYHCLTSKVYIFNSYVGDINAYTSGNVLQVNLWHGVGLKNIEWAISVGPLLSIFKEKSSILHKIKYLNHYSRPDIFLSTSQFMTDHFMKCFKLKPEQVFESMYPRCSILTKNKKELGLYIEKYEGPASICLRDKCEKYNEVYIYMPTWRDTQVDFISESQIDFEYLNEILQVQGDLFILKLHPATQIDLTNLCKYSNIVVLDSSIDIYPILPFTTCLITDYSSIYYDYLLLPEHKTILYLYDYEKYLSENRDFAFDFESYTGSNKCYNTQDLYYFILNSNLLRRNKKDSELAELFWSATASDTCINIDDRIQNELYNS